MLAYDPSTTAASLTKHARLPLLIHQSDCRHELTRLRQSWLLGLLVIISAWQGGLCRAASKQQEVEGQHEVCKLLLQHMHHAAPPMLQNLKLESRRVQGRTALLHAPWSRLANAECMPQDCNAIHAQKHQHKQHCQRKLRQEHGPDSALCTRVHVRAMDCPNLLTYHMGASWQWSLPQTHCHQPHTKHAPDPRWRALPPPPTQATACTQPPLEAS